jgi:hypothetical protein
MYNRIVAKTKNKGAAMDKNEKEIQKQIARTLLNLSLEAQKRGDAEFAKLLVEKADAALAESKKM